MTTSNQAPATAEQAGRERRYAFDDTKRADAGSRSGGRSDEVGIAE